MEKIKAFNPEKKDEKSKVELVEKKYDIVRTKQNTDGTETVEYTAKGLSEEELEKKLIELGANTGAPVYLENGEIIHTDVVEREGEEK